MLYEFTYEKSIDWNAFAQFVSFMKKKFGARAYMVNDSRFFRTHFIISSFLKSFFMGSTKLSKENFYLFVEVSINKLFNQFEWFKEGETLNEYFELFEKCMGL